jgi:hypothetical protein
MIRRGFAWGVGGAIASALALGCSSQATVGVLGNGQFRYLCSSGQTDSACVGDSASETELPAAIAVGATFGVGYAPASSNSGSTVQGETGYEIVPASAEFAAASGSTIVARRAGLVALLAQHVGNADVDDFVHLRFSTIQSLSANPASVFLSPGETQTLRLSAFDSLSAPLAGQLGCQWQVTSGASSVALQNTPPAGGVATLQATAGGSAVVHATCGTASVDIQVTISGAPAGDGGTNG